MYATPVPRVTLSVAKEVAIVLSELGNQVADKRDGAARANAHVMPFNMEPMAANLHIVKCC